MKPTGHRMIAAILAMTLVMALPAVTAEAQGGTTFTVRITDDTVDANPGDGICADADGDCSLRAAVQEANASAGIDTVKLRPDAIYSLTITGSGEDAAATGDLDITEDLVIRGRGSRISLEILFDRGLDVLAGATVDIDRLEIRNGRPAEGESGGAIRSAGTLNLSYFEARFNIISGAGASGAAIFNDGGNLFINRSTLELNIAEGSGGAIKADAGTTTILSTTMLSNDAVGDDAAVTPGVGGALHLTGAGVVSIDRSEILSNRALVDGGGLWNSSEGTMTITRTNIRNNRALSRDTTNGGGGGVFNDGGVVIFDRSRALYNSTGFSEGSGGGLHNNEGTMTITDSVIRFNEAAQAGGGIEVVNGTTTIESSRILTNTTGAAPGNGGGLHASGAAALVTITSSSVNSNTAANDGGGLWAAGGESSMTVTDSSVSRNEANGIADGSRGGGGLFNNGGLVEVTGTVIARNEAIRRAGSGAGILNLGTITMADSEVSRNDSNRGEGGGFWNLEGATMTVTTTLVLDNIARVRPNLFQQGAGGNFTINGFSIPPTITTPVTVSAMVDGGQANAGAGTGSTKVVEVVIDLNPDGTIDVQSADAGGVFIDADISIQAMHIHGPAPAGANGGVLINLNPLIDPTMNFEGSLTLEQQLHIDVIAADPDLFYINVHTNAVPGGEIRGQLSEGAPL